MKKLILLLLFIPILSFGQKSNDVDALKLCVALQSNNFTTDAEAEDAVNKILSVIGTSQKPILQACSNINNAVAAVYKGQRYILYDRDFMKSLTAGSNKYWSNMFILAHEVGHHINGHSLDIVLYASDIIDPKSLEEKRKQELEADEFAGFILAKLGASLSQTSKVLSNLPRISNENTSTHPSKDKRIASVRVGFKKGELPNSNVSKPIVRVKKEKESNNYFAWKKVKITPNDPFKKNEVYAYTYGKIIPSNAFNTSLKPKIEIKQSAADYDGDGIKDDTQEILTFSLPFKMIKSEFQTWNYYCCNSKYVEKRWRDIGLKEYNKSRSGSNKYLKKNNYKFSLLIVFDDKTELELEPFNHSYEDFTSKEKYYEIKVSQSMANEVFFKKLKTQSKFYLKFKFYHSNAVKVEYEEDVDGNGKIDLGAYYGDSKKRKLNPKYDKKHTFNAGYKYTIKGYNSEFGDWSEAYYEFSLSGSSKALDFY